MFNRVCLIALGIVIGASSVADATIPSLVFGAPLYATGEASLAGAVTTSLASMGGSVTLTSMSGVSRNPTQVTLTTTRLSAVLLLENPDGQSYDVICELGIDGTPQSPFSKTTIAATGSYGGGGPLHQTMALQGSFTPSAGSHTYTVMCAIAGGTPPPTSTLSIISGDLRADVIGL